MKGIPSVWVGADPGGKAKFGIAVLIGEREPLTESVDCADAALDFVRSHIVGVPAGVGVDAPLWWSSGRSSDRSADRWLRRRYGLGSGTVQTGNSLRGAALIQGALFVCRMREAYPEVPVTESHPKALLKATVGGSWTKLAKKYSVPLTTVDENERDAVIAAVCAREGFSNNWPNDLSVERLESEQDPKHYWLAPVHYFWPET